MLNIEQENCAASKMTPSLLTGAGGCLLLSVNECHKMSQITQKSAKMSEV